MSFGAYLRAWARHGAGLTRIRSAPLPEDGRQPRAEAVEHLQQVMASARAAGTIGGEQHVGDDLAACVSAFRLFFGEHGSGTIDETFKDPALVPILLQPSGNSAAQLALAARESAEWRRMHTTNPDLATTVAARLSPTERVALQYWTGKLFGLPRGPGAAQDPYRTGADTIPW
ncbi:hypothetical protein ACIBEA_21475 [Streptomyces sp. NPDC051555]|uniref:hypothetical protein n=1 Tax=Streptomyces sp. NPDC051555 TaxID=3365657 RepID=UPI0037B643A1